MKKREDCFPWNHMTSSLSISGLISSWVTRGVNAAEVFWVTRGVKAAEVVWDTRGVKAAEVFWVTRGVKAAEVVWDIWGVAAAEVVWLLAMIFPFVSIKLVPWPGSFFQFVGLISNWVLRFKSCHLLPWIAGEGKTTCLPYMVFSVLYSELNCLYKPYELKVKIKQLFGMDFWSVGKSCRQCNANLKVWHLALRLFL